MFKEKGIKVGVFHTVSLFCMWHERKLRYWNSCSVFFLIWPSNCTFGLCGGLRAWSDNVDPAFTKVTWTGSGPGGWVGSGLRYAAMLGYGLFDLPWLLQNRDASSHAECSYKTSFLSFSNFTNNDHIFNWLLNVRNRENIKINHALNHNYLMKPNNESFLKIETKICVLFETLDLDRKLENVNQHLKF